MFGEVSKQTLIEKSEDIKAEVSSALSSGKRVFSSSSFQDQSLPLLHILSQVKGFSDVYLTNTGFLFPETISFAHHVCETLGLELIKVESDVPKCRQVNSDGFFYYSNNPDLCCRINKVLPLQPVIANHDLWINGVRSEQSADRASLQKYEATNYSCKRYHPMLDWTSKDIFYYSKHFNLPSHPLTSQGYQSIGCEPCTAPLVDGNERNARWFGMNKTECGLITDLIVRE